MSKPVEIDLKTMSREMIQDVSRAVRRVSQGAKRFAQANPYLMPFAALEHVRANEVAVVQYEALGGISFDAKLPWEKPAAMPVEAKEVQDELPENAESIENEEMLVSEHASELLQATANAAGFRAEERTVPEGVGVQIFDLTSQQLELNQKLPVR